MQITSDKINLEKARLTRTAHHIQPMYHSIYERNPTTAQLEQGETNLSQTLMLLLQSIEISSESKTQEDWHAKRIL